MQHVQLVKKSLLVLGHLSQRTVPGEAAASQTSEARGLGLQAKTSKRRHWRFKNANPLVLRSMVVEKILFRAGQEI